jgi:hypothetical protein
MEKSYFIIEASINNIKFARYSAIKFNKLGHDYCIMLTKYHDQLDIKKVSREQFLSINNLNNKQ